MTMPTTPNPDAARDRVAGLRIALGAVAAGLWRVRGDHLEQEAFVPSPEMPAELAIAFAEATRSIARTQEDLGVVRAAHTDSVAVTLAGRVPAEAGSGYWLRAFGAARSVAVPLFAADGRVAAILSVALSSADSPDDRAVAEIVRAHGAGVVS